MKLVIPKGSVSRIITVFVQDSSLTTGAGLGSLTNASSIVGGFVREGSTGVALAVDEDVTTEGTYQAPSAQGKVRIGTPANMRTGTYELHFHNNLWATGAETVTITLGGATNMAPLNIEVQLSDAVRGLGAPTALPDAAAGAANGLLISQTLPDSVPADGTRPTLEQAAYMICQGLFEGSISGTTWAIKKVDGSTTLFTVTLDSATTPTSKTRSS